MMKRGLFTLGLLCMAVLLAGSCTGSVPGDVQQVTFIHYFTGSLSAGIDQLANAVNKEGAGVVLVASPMEHESYKTSIRVQLDGPNPPDLFSYWAGAKTKHLVEKNALEPLTPLFGTAIPEGSFPSSVMKALVYDGKPYMIPITQHFVGFFYNTRIFADAGISPPRDWQEFLSTCSAIKSKGITPLALGAKNRWPAQFWFDYLLLREAGYEWRTDLLEGRQLYDSPEVRRAFMHWKDLFDRGWFNEDAARVDWDLAAERVARGEAAMTLMGTWLVGTLGDKGYTSPDDYGFFVFPSLGLTVENTALGPIDGIMLSAGSRHKEAAMKALARFAQPEPQEAFSRGAGSIPPHSGVPADHMSQLQKEIIDIMNHSTHWAFNFDLATSPECSEAGLDALLDFVEKPDQLDAILADWDRKIRSIR